MNRKSPNTQKPKLSPSVICSTASEDEMVPPKKTIKKRTPAKKTPANQKKSENQDSPIVVPPTELALKTPGMCLLIFMPRRVELSSAMIDFDACSMLSAYASMFF